MQAVPEWLKSNPMGVEIGTADVFRELASCQDWETRYQRLLTLAERLPCLPASTRTESNRLHGCQATVWVTHAFDPVAGRLYINCDTDARVVKGLLACVLSGYNAQTLEAVRAFDAKAFLATLQLDDHLVSERQNGLLALVGKVRMLAHRYAA